MRDSGYQLRKAFFDALNGVVEFNSTAVPVVDGKLETLPTDGVFIVFGDQTDTDKSNKNSYAIETIFDLAVVDKRKSTGSKKDVEEVCDAVLQVIKPTLNTHGLTIASPFKITYVKFLTGLAASVAMSELNQFIQVKRIQFIIRITQ
jgi:hypothetical protein